MIRQLVLFSFILSICNAQSLIMKGVEVNYTYDEETTEFKLKLPLDLVDNATSSWIGIGLSHNPQMVCEFIFYILIVFLSLVFRLTRNL